MLDFFRNLFTTDFLPHGHCYYWRPGIVWLHVTADALIALAYFSIPISLRYFVAKRGDMPYPWLFRLFAAFIFACGCTHIFNIVTLWFPLYRFDGLLKLYTGIISLITAALLIPIIPQALALPSIKVANVKLRKLTSQLQQSNMDLQQFAAVASHDLREPLHTISGFAALLKKRYASTLDPKAHQYLDYTLKSVERMDELIHDLLRYSRVENLSKEAALVDTNTALQATLTDLQQTIEDNKAEINAESLPEIIADETQLKQIFQNLLTNAIKYHGERPPRIEISGRRSADGWTLAIKDYGIGIEPQHFENIFVMFKRLHSHAEYPGSGIGLALCKKIMERHGGKIWLESELKQGTTFYCFFPDTSGEKFLSTEPELPDATKTLQ